MNTSSVAFNSAANSNSSAKASTPTTDKAGKERDMFLKLLVAQLKNQDPLEPKDGTEFVQQLAQFSSLDQLISIKQGIDQLLPKK